MHDTVYSSRISVQSYLARELCDAAPGVSSTLRREDAKRLMMNYLSVHVTSTFLHVRRPTPRRVHHQAFLPRGTEARASSKIHFAFLSLTSDTLRPPLAMSLVHSPPVVVVVGPARGRPVPPVIVAAIVPAAPVVVPVPPVVPVSGPVPPVVSPVAAPVPARRRGCTCRGSCPCRGPYRSRRRRRRRRPCSRRRRRRARRRARVGRTGGPCASAARLARKPRRRTAAFRRAPSRHPRLRRRRETGRTRCLWASWCSSPWGCRRP